MMIAHPLSSSRIKIDRAKKHFRDLDVEIKVYSARNPYQVIVDNDSEPGIQIHRFHVIEHIPVTFSPIIGDLIHNLMSALDSLATTMVIASGVTDEESLSNTYFPIHWREIDFSKKPRTIAFFNAIGPDAEKLLRGIEPYKGGRGEQLLRMKNFDNQDKHRTIIPVFASVQQVIFHGYTPLMPRLSVAK